MPATEQATSEPMIAAGFHMQAPSALTSGGPRS
jgi:hypothetical protein